MATDCRSIFDLGPQPTLHIVSFLSARDCAVLSTSCTQFRALLSDDKHVWATHLQRDFATEQPLTPSGDAAPSFRDAYAAWAREFRDQDLVPFVRRAVVAWRKIKTFLSAHLPEAMCSLRPGATEEAIAAVEEQLGLKMPPALRALYRVHDGQELAFDRHLAGGAHEMYEEHMPSLTHGIFGGYEFYQHLTSVRMLPLSRMLHYTSLLRNAASRMARVFGSSASRHLLWAANAYDNGRYFKYFAVDTRSGSIRVAMQDRPHLAAPDVPGQQDAVLRWFEEYASRLECGWYSVEPLAEGLGLSSTPCRGICLFPKSVPQMAKAVTKGVQVRASVAYIPEMSCHSPPQHTFAYSIRFQLLPPDQQLLHWPPTAGPARALQSCQLLARHWVVLDAEGKPIEDREVRGEAVIGKYPLLRPGEPEFVYQSCTQQEELRGFMEGDFTFVEGTIRQPTGPEWDVLCPRFTLEVPQYIF